MENIKGKSIEIEIKGKTIEEAVEKAVVLLKVPRSQIKVKVLSEEQKGLFGMEGAKPAKIRATIICAQKAKKKS